MRPDIHPEYRRVVFLDGTSGERFVTRSTAATEETIDHDGELLPLVRVEVSSASHPFYTGKMTFIDTAGRVERFEQRYGRRSRPGAAGEG
jgi:large subunit ribosomal protein L31